MKVLFMCVANSARSQMAEGLAKNILDDSVEIQSAGSIPSGTVHSGAIKAMQRLDIDISDNVSKSVDDLSTSFLNGLDFVITLCAEEVCPILISGAKKLHWPTKDPAAVEGEDQSKAFENARDFIKDKLEKFLAARSSHEPAIRELRSKKLVGKKMTMSLSHNKTGELWRDFMKERHEIKNGIGSDLYSTQKYDPLYFSDFNPDTEFDKWASIEVTDFADIPDCMESITLEGGLYAVFLYKGSAKDGAKIFQYIFGTWLPNSKYLLSDRYHFEIIGAKYKNESPDSEEEIWIPIKNK